MVRRSAGRGRRRHRKGEEKRGASYAHESEEGALSLSPPAAGGAASSPTATARSFASCARLAPLTYIETLMLSNAVARK